MCAEGLFWANKNVKLHNRNKRAYQKLRMDANGQNGRIGQSGRGYQRRRYCVRRRLCGIAGDKAVQGTQVHLFERIYDEIGFSQLGAWK